MSIGKCVLAKTGPGGPNDIHRRIGLVNDDCENSAIQMRNVLRTLATCKTSVSAEYFHGPIGGLSDKQTKQREVDMETLRGMRIGNLSKREQRCILLIGEAIHGSVEAELGYFVTGSASQTSDTDDTKEGLSVQLPVSVGQGIGVFNATDESRCNPPRRTPFTQKDAAVDSETGGLSGHCTCTLHSTRPDGHIQAMPVEGTGFVIMTGADIKVKVFHRGALTPANETITENTGDVGRFNEKITVDNVVDVTMDGFVTSHVATICSAMSVPECSMRASMVMGTAVSVKNNMEKFYKNLVSTGRYQMVQKHRNSGIQPGCDVKKFVAQGVFPTISIDSITKDGGQLDGISILKRMGNAPAAMIEVFDKDTEEFENYNKSAQLMSDALAPLRMTVAAQDQHIACKYWNLDSLQAFFPGESALLKQYGENNSFTFFVSYLPNDTSTAGEQTALRAIKARVDHMNNQFVNVRFADPHMTPAGEFVVLIKMYAYFT